MRNRLRRYLRLSGRFPPGIELGEQCFPFLQQFQAGRGRSACGQVHLRALRLPLPGRLRQGLFQPGAASFMPGQLALALLELLVHPLALPRLLLAVADPFQRGGIQQGKLLRFRLA